MNAAVRTVLPPLDEPWRRLAWITPLSILVWAAVLICFSFLLEQTAPPPPELKPLEARIVELPPTAGLQSLAAAPTPAKARVEVKHKAATPPLHTRNLQIPPKTMPSPRETGNSATQPAPPSASSFNENARKGETASGVTGTGSGLGSDSAGARAIYAPIPKIPDELREDTFEAVAVAHFKVSYEGVVEVSLATPTSSPRLNEILIDTLKQWRFSPAMKNGIAIDSEFEVRIPITVQ